MKRRLVLLGAGSHATVIADILVSAGIEKPPYTAIDLSTIPWRKQSGSKRKSNLPTGWLMRQALTGLLNVVEWADIGSLLNKSAIQAIPAIGDNRLREEICRLLESYGIPLQGISHPSAVVSRHAQIDPGVVICAGAIIGTGAWIGAGSIINTRASVDHDCHISPYVHIAPRAALGGNVTIETRAWVGLGACVREGIRIGSDAIVGAGAMVVKNVPASMTVAGVPARPLKR